MTKLLKQAMERLSQLSPAAQDTAALALMQQLEEEPEPGDTEAIAAGREDFARGDFSTLKEWRHEVGLGATSDRQAAAPKAFCSGVTRYQPRVFGNVRGPFPGRC